MVRGGFDWVGRRRLPAQNFHHLFLCPFCMLHCSTGGAHNLRAHDCWEEDCPQVNRVVLGQTGFHSFLLRMFVNRASLSPQAGGLVAVCC
jgi:hypothetical protein